MSRPDAVFRACCTAAADPAMGRRKLREILIEDSRRGRGDDRQTAWAVLTVATEILERAVPPWDFTWDINKGLRPETPKMTAARLLVATEATGDVDKFVGAVEALKPLLEKEQALAAAARLLEKIAETGSVGDISVAAGKLARANLVTAPQIDGACNAAAAKFNRQIPWPAEATQADAERAAA